MTGIRFGYCLPTFANPSPTLFRTPNMTRVDARKVLDLGIHAERLGFDSLWVADHLMLGDDETILEGWTMLSALAASTSNAQLGMIHQGHYVRSPGVAAKMGATLDQLSGGRFVLFYDPGHQEREHRAYRLPYPGSPDQRAAETIDGLRLILDLWRSGTPVTAAYGESSATAAVCSPGPVQQPHPPLWFGETHPLLLSACAAFGQGWNSTPCSVQEFRQRVGLLREACTEAGRDVEDLELCVELQVLCGPEDWVRSLLGAMLDKAADQAAVDPALRAFAAGSRSEPPAWLSATTLIGDADGITQSIQEYIEAGANHFLLWFLDAPGRTGMEYFAREIAARFRPNDRQSGYRSTSPDVSAAAD